MRLVDGLVWPFCLLLPVWEHWSVHTDYYMAENVSQDFKLFFHQSTTKINVANYDITLTILTSDSQDVLANILELPFWIMPLLLEGNVAESSLTCLIIWKAFILNLRVSWRVRPGCYSLLSKWNIPYNLSFSLINNFNSFLLSLT